MRVLADSEVVFADSEACPDSDSACFDSDSEAYSDFDSACSDSEAYSDFDSASLNPNVPAPVWKNFPVLAVVYVKAWEIFSAQACSQSAGFPLSALCPHL